MAVDSAHRDGPCDWHGRWSHVRRFLERPGPFTHPDFEPSTEVIDAEGMDSQGFTYHTYHIPYIPYILLAASLSTLN